MHKSCEVRTSLFRSFETICMQHGNRCSYDEKCSSVFSHRKVLLNSEPPNFNLNPKVNPGDHADLYLVKMFDCMCFLDYSCQAQLCSRQQQLANQNFCYKFVKFIIQRDNNLIIHDACQPGDSLFPVAATYLLTLSCLSGTVLNYVLPFPTLLFYSVRVFLLLTSLC